jgi:pimeloyl-ACP methyl ester carboxylesterase
MATDLTHRTVETNGIRMHLAEQGSGPLVLLCHGFPESWYSWRHQLPALAAAGYRAVAPDMRGYGQTDRPERADQYTMLHLVGDMVGVLDALGEQTCVIAGHDWGAPVAWNAALMRPDRFRAVAGLSVPYAPRGSVPPLTSMRQTAGEKFFYMLYFQEPGVAEAELERDVAKTMRTVMYSGSGESAARRRTLAPVPKNGKWFDALVDSAVLPQWLTQVDLDFYAAEFQRTGFRGGLNWYRNLDRNWELMAPYRSARIGVPALFVAGEQDMVIRMYKGALDNLPKTVPNLTRSVLLPECGHWVQQERPAEVNAALLQFLAGLPAQGS